MQEVAYGKEKSKMGADFLSAVYSYFFGLSVISDHLQLLSELTFQENSRNFVFVGFDNYKDLINDKTFWKSVGNTWKIWLMNFIPQLIFGLVLAILLTQYKIKGAGFFRAVFYLPNLITVASMGVLFLALFDWQTGSVNNALVDLGILKEKVNWMSSPSFAQGITAFIQWLMWFGYSSILLTAGIAAIPDEVIESSVIDGANAWKRLTKITLPLLKPTMLYVMVTSLIGGMQIFDIPMTLTKGSGEPSKSLMTMVLYLYNMAFKNNDLPYGATISYGIFVIIIFFSLIFFKVIYGKEEKSA